MWRSLLLVVFVPWPVAVAYEELDSDNPEAEGNDFELIGLLATFDPPPEDTKQAIDNAT